MSLLCLPWEGSPYFTERRVTKMLQNTNDKNTEYQETVKKKEEKKTERRILVS
jgi:hypothetical protein